MNDPKHNGSNGTARSHAVVASRVVSKPGARVVEKVVVLSDYAAARLQIRGEVPARGESSAAAGARRG